MAQAIPDIVLSRLSDFLAKEMGLQFPRERWRDLERGVAAVARELGCGDLDECIRWLMSAPLSRQQIETLASTLTIGETYFFRDTGMLEALEHEILPALVRDRSQERRLRIWSAGCSSGEEAYTVAILLHRILPDLPRWNITILATDINRAALKKGIAGSYGKWSFRATPAWFKSGYFSPAEEGELRVIEEVRRMVSFEYLNLAEDSYPSLPTNTNAMDLIFCRNVLMYFSEQTVESVVNKLQKSLVEDGWLIVGPADLPARVAPLQPVSFRGATCYRKRTGRHPCLAAPQPAGPVHKPPVSRGGEQELQGIDVSSTAAAKAAGKTAASAAAEGGAAAGAALSEAAGLFRRGLYAEAAAKLAALADGGELSAEGTTLLVRSYANQGKLPEAIEVCDRALQSHKLDPSLHYLRAEILQEQGLSAEAKGALLRALYLDPQLVMAHFALGNLFLWSGHMDKSQRHFRNALELLQPMDPGAVVPDSEGMTAGRLREIIGSVDGGLRRAGGGGR